MPYHAETIVVGCGNILFKDDGFGPFVIHKLEEYFEDKEMPDEVMFIDAGTGATHFIFSLPDEYWKKVIVIDVVEFVQNHGLLKYLALMTCLEENMKMFIPGLLKSLFTSLLKIVR